MIQNLEPIHLMGLPKGLPPATYEKNEECILLVLKLEETRASIEDDRDSLRQLPMGGEFERAANAIREKKMNLRAPHRACRVQLNEFWDVHLRPALRRRYDEVAQSIEPIREGIHKSLLKIGFTDPALEGVDSYPVYVINRHPKLRAAMAMLDDLHESINHLSRLRRENDAAIARLDADIEAERNRAIAQL